MTQQPLTNARKITVQTRLFLPLAALLVVAIVWLSLLQTTMSAANDPSPDSVGLVGPLMDDSGEFVIAWHTWGVTHPPGYPLLSLIANLLTRLYGLFISNGVAAASLVSFTFGLLALAAMAQPIWQLDRHGVATATAILLPAFGQLTWLYSSVAEAYSMGLLLGFGALALATETGSNPHRTKVWLLGLVFGLGVGHHRTLLALLPALAIAAWPARKLGWRVWLGALVFFFLSFSVYLYLPVVKALGSPWVYGRPPHHLEGFLDAFIAREYSGQITPPIDPLVITSALIGRLTFLARETSGSGLVIGILGLGMGFSHPGARRTAAALVAVVGCYLLAPVSQSLLIGTHLLIMVTSLALAAACGLGLVVIERRPLVVSLISLAITGSIVPVMLYNNWDRVAAYTKDPLGQRIIAAVKTIPEEKPAVVEMWGPRYFALAYGKLVSQELAPINLIDGRRELSNAPSDRNVIYTTQDSLYLYPVKLWSQKLGASVIVESAGDGIVVIRREPRIAKPLTENSPTDIVMESARAWTDVNSDIRVTVEWRCVRHTSVDYHVFVKITDQPQIAQTGDIIAQGDRWAPVYGFYPTSGWQENQLIGDDYRVKIPPGRIPSLVVVGLYTMSAGGGFNNYLSANIPVGP